jgi:hypothetical protein
MKILLIVFIFLLSNFQQQPTTNELIGIWKVTDLVIDTSSPLAANKAFVSKISPMLMKTVFTIKADHSFNMKGEGLFKDPVNGIWEYNAINHWLKVTEKRGSKSRLVEIMVFKNKEGKMCFSLSETPVMLIVQKQQ